VTDDSLVKQGSGDLEPVGDPIPDPGLPEHRPRPTDVDPKAEKRAERQIAGLFGFSSLCAILFCVAYFTFDVGDNPDTVFGAGASNVFLGLTMGLALLAIGVGIVHWSRKIMVDHEIVEMRHSSGSSQQDREYAVDAFNVGVEDSGIMRRPLIRNSLLGAVATALLPAVVVLRDLGPLPGDKLYHTVWAKGMRVVRDVSGSPISAADMEVGDLINAQPDLFFHPELYGAEELDEHHLLQEKAKAAVILVRMRPEEIKAKPERENWHYNGILCFSKICTHVGCPISLYEQQTHHLLCPCHQSTFDLADNGKVVFGPAARALPQLPLTVDSQGFLVATDDFDEPVGPSFWERG
jgi:ubiquinol-cytochrome c reductase iron-sulfur subunit